ncbi:MAG: Na+-dependent transporter [Firmicutes bacterium]|nr:Na+-dependent transporter [Bacillota bacterium]
MNLTTLPTMSLQISIFLTVFAVGFTTQWHDVLYLLKKPGLLLKSVLSMNIIMPVVALIAALSFHLNPAVVFTMIVFAVSPVPPMLPKKVVNAEGDNSYTIALLVSAAVLSVVFAPLSMYLLGLCLGKHSVVQPSTIAQIVTTTILAPLFLGMIFRHFLPGFVERTSGIISRTAPILMLAGLIPILISSIPGIISLMGNGTLIAFTGFVLAGLTAGHLLGGPEHHNRTVLAVSTILRHPGVAISIAGTNFPDKKLAIAAIMLYMVVNAIVSMPYIVWQRKRAGKG